MESKVYSLNKADPLKRLAAWFLDMILIVTIAVGFMVLTSVVIGYDKEQAKLNEYYQIHNVFVEDENGNNQFCEISSSNDSCSIAWENFGKDKDAVNQYNKVNQLTVVILSSGVFLSLLTTHFIAPLILKDGRTIGKRLLGVSLVSTDEIKVTTKQMFIWFLMGEFLVVTMIPILLKFTAMISGGGLIFSLTALAIWLINIGCVLFTKNRQNLPDLIAKTIAVDTSSQIICETKEDLAKLKYQNS